MAAKRQRNYAAEYARRQQRARERGFTSYYQKRVAGTTPGSEERALAAGRRGYSQLLRGIREGSIVGIDPVESVRNSKGQWTVVYVTVLDVYGNEKRYRLSGKQLDSVHIQGIVDRISDAGAISSPTYPIGIYGDESDVDDEFDVFDFDDYSEETA